MSRFFAFIIQIALLAAVAIWLADRPGTAHIVWHDTVIETSAAFLALCVFAVAFAIHLVFRLWHFLRYGPSRWRLRRKLSKIQQGQDQLTLGLIAVASGNATEAGRLAVAARKNVGNAVAAQWLQAQAAQLASDHVAARAIFRTLAANADAAVLGYRGLITEAKRAGKWEEVDQLMTELYRIKPATPWLSVIRMESSARRQQWVEAESALSHAVTAHLMDSDKGRRTRAALRIAVSRSAAATGQETESLQAAEEAARQAPEWLPALINLSETLAKSKHKRAATRIIERTWKSQPHPQLAQILRLQSNDNLDAYKQVEHLCRASENTIESHIALAEAAMAAEIWGEARRHLMQAVADKTATQSVYRMLARLERRERGDERAATSWFMKVAEAPADPTWLCRTCGGTHSEWQPLCGHCGAFDTIEWQRQGQSRPQVAEVHNSLLQ
jgi:HemY protein